MSMVFHFLKKDIRRSAWLFALWFLLFVIDGIFVMSAPPPAINAAMATGFTLNPNLFPVLKFLVLAVLVPRIVQEDAVIGSTAFWLARPVSRRALFLAKLAGLGLVVLIAILVDSGVLLTFGVSARELGSAVVILLLSLLFFVVPMTLLAALTSSFGKFIAAIVTLAIGLISASLRFVPPSAESFARMELDSTRNLVVTALLVVGGGLLLTHQYLTRRGKRSIILTLCLLGACILVDLFWPWNLVRTMPVRSSPAVFDLTGAAVRIGVGQLNNSPYTFPSGSLGRNIDGYCSFSGIPPEYFMQVRSVVPRLSTPDGMEIATLGAVRTVPFSTFDPPAVSAISAAIGDIPVYSFTLGTAAHTTFATIDHATFLRYKESPVKLEDDIDVVVSRYELTAEMPLVVGSRYDKGSVHVRIDGLFPSDDGIAVVVSESSLSGREAVHVSNQSTDPRQKGDPIYLLVNRGRREAALTSSNGGGVARDIRLDLLIVRQSVNLPFTHKDNPRSPVIDRQWLAGAALVRLERIPVAEFNRTAAAELPKLGEPWLSAKATAGSVTAGPLRTDESYSGTVSRALVAFCPQGNKRHMHASLFRNGRTVVVQDSQNKHPNDPASCCINWAISFTTLFLRGEDWRGEIGCEQLDRRQNFGPIEREC